MFFKKAQMCLNEPDYITVHSVINIMAANRAKGCTKCHNNIFQLFLCLICSKRVITSTQKEILQFGLAVMYIFLLFYPT